MNNWPVPNSYSKKIPLCGSPGCFWEDRGDRRHCGIDIYAPFKSPILSIDDGLIIKTGIFTSPEKVKYWNETNYIIVKDRDGFYIKYAELSEISVNEKQYVRAGQVIGFVGTVLNNKKIKDNSPIYIRDLKRKKNLNMLHFELYKIKPFMSDRYLGGNWFGKNKPKNLLNPETKFSKNKDDKIKD